MKSLEAIRADTLRQWKASEISLADAARVLTWAGVPALEAWRILEGS